jgi:integration host factor subunit alpha
LLITLADGEDLLLSGFGKFLSARKKNELEKLMVPARRAVVFKTSGVLRRRVNGENCFLGTDNSFK